MAHPDPLPTDPMDPRDELVTHLGVLRAFSLNLTRNDAAADDLCKTPW